MSSRDDLLFDLRLGPAKAGIRHLTTSPSRRLPGDDLAEKIAAEQILEHLELCGWRIEHPAPPMVTPAR
jgi:hypothetical protein